MSTRQLISYIALSAPATRRPATGDEPFLRPEVGFTPKWFHKTLGIIFGERWHTDPSYRRDAIIQMGQEVKRRFGKISIGCMQNQENPLDLITGTFGAYAMAGIYGIPIIYASDNWPNTKHRYLSDEEADKLNPPDLDSNPFFNELMEQVEWIASVNGCVEGYINWQGVLNNAYRLRGSAIFMDMADEPKRANHMFDCVFNTMIDAASRLYDYQRQTGMNIQHFTVSNCLVNMISPEKYAEFLLPYDIKIAEKFGLIGIHNCAWNADPYIEHYSKIPDVGYIDMGMESDLSKTKTAFSSARRAIMYKPTDVANKTIKEIKRDLERIAKEYAPCDIVFADIEWNTPDNRIIEIIDICNKMSEGFEEKL